jgi:transcriptional regulator with XRE-family HTH domain
MSTKSKKEIQSIFQNLLSFDTKEELIERDKNRLHFKFLSSIEEILEEKNISKKDLAISIGTSPSFITQLFRGNKTINFEMLAKIQQALEISYEIKVTQNDKKEKHTPLYLITRQKSSLRMIPEFNKFKSKSSYSALIA